MAEVAGSNSWREELTSLIEDTGVRYAYPTTDAAAVSAMPFESRRSELAEGEEGEPGQLESFKDQAKEFFKAWGELLVEFGRGCRDIVQQSIVTEDSFLVQKFGGPVSKVCGKLSVLNDYLPEDRHPVHSWSVILFVLILAVAVLSVNNNKHDSPTPPVKKVFLHPPSASRVLLPDGRYMAYRELGVPADRARFSVIVVHSFLSSRLAGIPGIKDALLEEFGVRFITYDLPGFGESDPHSKRNLNTSASDLLSLANALGVNEFWMLGFSSGAMHALAALKYIPSRIAGVAMFAPMVNPYDPSMTKEEMSRTWEKWLLRRKFTYFLARRFPRFLTSFYHRSFLSGKHSQIDKCLPLSLGNKDKALVDEPLFEEFWHRDVEESIRQGNARPFIEEAALQVSNWGFSLTDLQVQKKCHVNGIISWFKSIYSPEECELVGFKGPIHVWQGMDDRVVPPSMIDYLARAVPAAILHKLPNQGHFSYFFFCDECHRQIFSVLFGNPEGPLNRAMEVDQTPGEMDQTPTQEAEQTPGEEVTEVVSYCLL